MKLLTAELRAQLPTLYSQEHVTNPIVHVKFFTPDSNWTWYATEGAEEDEEEWGYFFLSRLESAKGPLNLSIERDLYFKPAPFSEVLARERGHRGQ